MKKFQFRLEPVLKIRKHKEREWELKLAEITSRCLSLRIQIEARKEAIRDSFHTQGPLDIVLLSAGEAYRGRLSREIGIISEELELLEEEREKVRVAYSKASMDRKVLDKLSERKSREYYTEQFREEIKNLDDLTGGRDTRRALSGLTAV